MVRSVGAAWHWCARKTHCPQRHPYDTGNTYRDRLGKRHCRTCNRVGHRRAYWRAKAAAA